MVNKYQAGVTLNVKIHRRTTTGILQKFGLNISVYNYINTEVCDVIRTLEPFSGSIGVVCGVFLGL